MMERRTPRSAQQRRVDCADDVMPLVSPREREIDEGKTAGANRQPEAEAVFEISGAEAVFALSHFRLLGQHIDAKRSPDRMLDALL